ncbi:RNA-directed DNA polymerase (reverse transcriptase)-related family protein [Rhynchospora pubera]|uniref:RNA-directed DNA polymerase (Reverse transcriptase)-related family protein n=1 Tax=Rhynchospora pubera TaxID=906938 RepID=A0AAV8FDH8_9POAL|nr:RNA-directed DNA polymerase (reverse transcriptase)-related family protein [Rhynchospora pubera]
MSPYAFIMAMEILTRAMTKAAAQGRIQGIKVAELGPRVTHVIYADDLVIMGDTAEQELLEYANIMNRFGKASGLVINPTKSKIWLSKRCDESTRVRVQQIVQADMAQVHEKYLGSYLKQPTSASLTGKLLVEKINAKLAGWKSSMLSHAGRLVLIKSVLASLPVYYMSTEQIPKRWLKEMTSIIARFFWGKVGKTRYMTLIAWDKICKPIDKGGLGVRNLHDAGEALFLKLAWAIVSEDDKLWVQLCKAKYFHKEGSWGAGIGMKPSMLWRQIVNKRDFFKNDVTWQLNDGTKVNAISQPWYSGWEISNNMARQHGQVKVADLFDQQTRLWKMRELNLMFGHEKAEIIHTQVSKPEGSPLLVDKLIWLKAKNGKYTVKQGYAHLQEGVTQVQRDQSNLQWVDMWNWKGVIPKVKVFIWRLISKTLPVAQNMHRRIHGISPVCHRCGTENEFETHCMFFRPSSRVVWFGSRLGLATHNLPLSIEDAFTTITQGLDEEGRRYVCYTLWEIWLARNQEFFQHKKLEPTLIWRKVNEHINFTSRIEEEGLHSSSIGRHQMSLRLKIQEWMVIIDASCDAYGKAGMATLMYRKGELMCVVLNHQEEVDPFWGEALALLQALKCLKDSI